MVKSYTESNPPAFPTTMPLDGWGDPNQGMTLRDWFAGQALTGMMANASFPVAANQDAGPNGSAIAGIAESAYNAADAMMEARK